MNLWNSNIYLSDLKKALSSVNIEYYKNKSILITGATGLIGSAIVDIFLMMNHMYNTNIIVYVAGRSKEEDDARFPYGDELGMRSVYYDATKEISFEVSPDFMIHCASNASPDKYISEPVETMLANIFGAHNLLSAISKNSLKKFLYVSSSEVYGRLPHNKPMTEDEYGYIDVLSVRSSYSMGKRAAETMCISHSKENNVYVCIVRPGHIYGPTSLPHDKRIASDFARKAAKGEPLLMKSEGNQIRSYCHCLDCATAMLKVLEKGENGQAYNISNPNSIITIKQMAEILSVAGNVELVMDLPSTTEKKAFNPMSNSSLDSSKLEALGWTGNFSAEYGLTSTVNVIKEII